MINSAISNCDILTKKLNAVTSAPAPVAASAPASGVGAGASILGAGAAALAATAAVRPNKRCAKKDKVVRLATATEVDVDTECINAIRFLAVDAVNKANSGHPGAPMGQAPIGYLLFAEEMQYNPEDPKWVNRDRFVLSSGHGCMLQYSLLHLAGYDSVSIDDIKQFRQWGSKTPGHPENFETDGIEVQLDGQNFNYSFSQPKISSFFLRCRLWVLNLSILGQQNPTRTPNTHAEIGCLVPDL